LLGYVHDHTMRALLVTSIAAACAGAALLPLAPTGSTDFTLSDTRAAPTQDAAPPAVRAARSDSRGPLPGHTQSLPLGTPADSTRSGDKLLSAWQDDPSGGRRVASRKVKPFSMVGVVWDDARAIPRGQLQVQTQASGEDRWSAWRSLNTHGDHGPDPGSSEHSGAGSRALGATAPLWVGDSRALRVRIVPEAASSKATGSAHSRRTGKAELPRGARLELVDPGDSDAGAKGAKGAAGTAKGNPKDGPGQGTQSDAPQPPYEAADVPGGTLPALTKTRTRATYGDEAADATPSRTDRPEDARIGPRPRIITRKGWGADETLREPGYSYTRTTKAAFVHHSAETNNYSCAQVPSIIRGIYRYHVKSSRWRDIGYNFLVDKCGNIYEGRAGGAARAVMGAHTYGFNTDTTGIAVLGTYSKAAVSKAATDAVARLTAWKLGVHGVDAGGKVTLISGGGTKHRKGSRVVFNAVSGHRDGYVTDCPGDRLYNELPAIRTQAGRLQRR
jgi:uncharacterized protein with LGFP repeats